VSRTGKERPVSSDPDVPGSLLSPLGRWLTVAGVALLGAVTVLGQRPGQSSAFLIVAAVLGYLLAFVVYLTLASLARSGSWVMLVLAAAAGLGVSLTMSHWRWPGALAAAPVIFPALAVGLAARSKSPATAFWTGALVLIGVMIARDLTAWRAQIELLQEAAPLVASDISGRMQAVGIDGTASEAVWIKRIDILSWYLPGLMTCSALVPFSIGSLWFFTRTARITGQPADTGFIRWTLPRLFLPVALFAALGHLLGQATVRQVSDNILLALAVAFAIIGTASLEYVFRVRTVPIWLRVIVYIALIAAHLYGLLGLIAVGAIDTLIGRRRGSKARKAGKDSVS
jgi:hypothetical protein